MQDELVDGIIHLAAESHVDRSIKDPFTFAQTNVMGTLSLLQAAKHYWESQPKPWFVEHDGHVIPSDEGASVSMSGVDRFASAEGLGMTSTHCRFYHISTDEVYGALEMTHPEGIEPP